MRCKKVMGGESYMEEYTWQENKIEGKAWAGFKGPGYQIQESEFHWEGGSLKIFEQGWLY